MNRFEKPKADPAMGTHPVISTVSELLGDSGKCRQRVNQALSHQLLFSEQQKLRQVLDWAEGFLRSRSQVCYEFCRADSLLIADGEMEEISPACEFSLQPSLSNYKNTSQQNISIHFDLLLTDSCPRGRDEETWMERRESEDMKSTQLEQATNKQTPSQGNYRTCRTHEDTSDQSNNQTLASATATHDIKDSSTGFGAVDTLQPLHKSTNFTDKKFNKNGAQSKAEKSEDPKESSKEVRQIKNKEKKQTESGEMKKTLKKIPVQESSSNSAAYKDHKSSHSKRRMIHGLTARTANPSLTYQAKLLSNLTVYEQNLLCVDQQHGRRKCKSIDPECVTHSQEKEKKTQEETAGSGKASPQTFELHDDTINPLNRTAAQITEDRKSCIISESQDRFNLTSAARVDLHGKKSLDFLKKTRGDSNGAGVDNTTESSRMKPEVVDPSVQETDAPPGSVKNMMRPLSRTGPLKTIKHPKRKLCERSNSKTSMRGLFSKSNQDAIKYKKRLNSKKCRKILENRDSSSQNYENKIKKPTETLQQQEPTPTTKGSVGHVTIKKEGCKCRPAGVPVSEQWLSLPDEVWLSILSELYLRDLFRVLQVCHRLHTLATDHTLWKNIRIENCTLSDQWLLCVGRRRPLSLHLYSCSSLSVSSWGLEGFFSLCRDSLEDVEVTSCTGPGLHGDQMLSLIGQLCDNVTRVDVSWSGATDTGLKALSECSRFKLKSLVLNGCYVTDVPLKKLVMKHKMSLQRLEVFGCQYLTPSCLQNVYEMCPGLQHLNIGRVPKVSVHSLTILTSQLKCLFSLNLTGLRVVKDGTVKTLLQNCVKLQDLTLSSCPGVTDLTLHNISKYSPCIRSFNVSGCTSITDAGIQSLALGCRRLQSLDLSSTGTGNRGVSLLANYCSGHLHTVKLSFCHITSEIILKLCRQGKRLKVLHIYGCADLPTEREIRDVNRIVEVDPSP